MKMRIKIVVLGIASSFTTNMAMGQSVEFVSITGDTSIESFEMTKTEITNEQYCLFLNEAWNSNQINYDNTTKVVTNLTGQSMINLGGIRVTKDHNFDGTYALDEMENPLNRCFIEYNAISDSFQIVNPATVDWNVYFDQSIYPNVVDNINDWAELNPNQTGFYEEPDSDKLLPSIEEVTIWPVNHIQYYGAEGFADFYGYELPTKLQWRYAGQGGQNFQYATSNGIADTSVAWYHFDGPPTIFKGHVQPALSKQANPYGIYNLGGNVWEWCKDWYNGTSVFGGTPKLDSDYFIDDALTFADANGNYLKCLIGGSFNFFAATMGTTWNHAANMTSGNDHFGFRVCHNSSTSSINDYSPNNTFEFYPNPSSSTITVKNSIKGQSTINIYSSIGRLVYSNNITSSTIIDVSNLNKGMYYISINGVSKKLIVN